MRAAIVIAPRAESAMDARSSNAAGQVTAGPKAIRRNLDQRLLQLLTRQWESDTSQLLRPAAHQSWPGTL
ncbi:hypothetical protein KBY57_11950 [Cyanobium sp. Aljojuca 7D2]|uniref:hypothetical protein n=1 Tax=Cyanobium sp. Aljojuca 7D2 TaxID=2823698 RepID=UPI0020CEFC6F|nr:hypothetical protein [Cyanobium sp. Aljojuca 7D2]MCP9891758.1 hypothetical protein [Cyanobium sp. Aljojuca 7D2]